MAKKGIRTRALNPAQVRQVAEERYRDAKALMDPKHRRYNGAVYLCGLVLDCLFKAWLLEKNPHLSAADMSTLSKPEKRIHDLIFRSHDLAEMLAHLPEIMAKLSLVEQPGSTKLQESLRILCTEWSIQLRYSTSRVNAEDAMGYFSRLTEVKRWLARE